MWPSLCPIYGLCGLQPFNLHPAAILEALRLGAPGGPLPEASSINPKPINRDPDFAKINTLNPSNPKTQSP